jgi:hypothetical protein
MHRMGSIAAAAGLLRLENLDVNVSSDGRGDLRTQRAAGLNIDNSSVPIVGHRRLRDIAARHVR